MSPGKPRVPHCEERPRAAHCRRDHSCGLDQRDDLEAQRQGVFWCCLHGLLWHSAFENKKLSSSTRQPEGRRFISWSALRLCEFARSTSTPSLSTWRLCDFVKGVQKQQYFVEYTVPAPRVRAHSVMEYIAPEPQVCATPALSRGVHATAPMVCAASALRLGVLCGHVGLQHP